MAAYLGETISLLCRSQIRNEEKQYIFSTELVIANIVPE